MAELEVGACRLWKPTSGGLGAVVTVRQIDAARSRALIHLVKASTGSCAAHWVELATLSPAPEGARPCACEQAPRPTGNGHEAA